MKNGNLIIDIDDSRIEQPSDKLGFSSVVYCFSKFIELPNLELKKYRGADLGCGIGSISVVLLNKFSNLNITGIDIDESSIQNSIKTAKLSNVSHKYIGKVADIRNISSFYPEENFHLIFSNPPYFKVGKGRISPKLSLARAKYEIDGALEDFIKASSYLMKKSGYGYILQHISRLQELFSIISRENLVVSKLQFIYTNGGIDAKNVMVEFRKRYLKEIRVLQPIFLKNGEIIDGVKF